MSADNGLILWQDGDDYILSEYNASHDNWEDKPSLPRRADGPDLERVLRRAQEIMRQETVEYGLSLELGQTSDVAAEPALAETGPRSRPSSLASS